MRHVSRFLALVALWGSLLTLWRPQTGLMSIVLWIPKLLAGALAPVGMLVGGAAALFGLLRRDWLALLAGVVGTAVAGRYIRRVTSTHDGFGQAFGANWEAQIPAGLRARMLPRRWQPLVLDTARARWEQDIVYGTHPETGDELLADLWRPLPDTPRSGLALIYVHGGAWRYGTKNMGTQWFFRHLAGQGHVVMDIAYVLAPRNTIPGMVADVRRAVAWMKAHGPELGVDPECVVLMGGSAGAHLALLTAFSQDSAMQPWELRDAGLPGQDRAVDTAVCAVISYYGPPDYEALHQSVLAGYGRWGGSGLLAQLLQRLDRHFKSLSGGYVEERFENPLHYLAGVVGGTPEELPEVYRQISPLAQVGPHCPPTLIVQNSHDFSGMMPQVAHLYDALRAAGVAVIYVDLPNTEHAFDLVLPWLSPAAQAATYDTERFLGVVAGARMRDRRANGRVAQAARQLS